MNVCESQPSHCNDNCDGENSMADIAETPNTGQKHKKVRQVISPRTVLSAQDRDVA